MSKYIVEIEGSTKEGYVSSQMSKIKAYIAPNNFEGKRMLVMAEDRALRFNDHIEAQEAGYNYSKDYYSPSYKVILVETDNSPGWTHI